MVETKSTNKKMLIIVAKNANQILKLTLFCGLNEVALRVTNCLREFVFACACADESMLAPWYSSVVSDVSMDETDTS